jgi:hypothetical protein
LDRPQTCSGQGDRRNGCGRQRIASDIYPDVLLDALYGGLYYWLFFDPAKLTTTYIDSLFELVLHGWKPVR